MSLYQDHLLDHYRNPRNAGTLPHPTHHADEYNPSCGDKLAMDIEVEHDKIKAIKFTGSGCAISQASASLLTEAALGKSVAESLSLSPEETLKLLQTPLSPTRMKCALLSLQTLKAALRSSNP